MFIKNNKDSSPFIDTVFNISSLAIKAKKEGKEIINASLGTLHNENNELVTLNSFYKPYKDLDNLTLAKYSSSFNGNLEFKNAIKDFILEDKLNNLNVEVIATSGGTGAIYLAIQNILDKNQKIIIPDIGWSNYELMAKENNLTIVHYKMFKNNVFNLDDLKEKILDSLNTQNKAFIILNSPLHNPTGYTIKDKDINKLVQFINTECINKEIIILNDIAYIDYSFNLNKSRNYLKNFNNLNSNTLLLIAYSCSKSFTIYGMRLGALLIANKDKHILEHVINAFNKSCRSIYSNINNSAMVNVTNVLSNNKEDYLKEKEQYINLLKERSLNFIKEAKKHKLELYPYNEGFFITIKVNNNIKEKYHALLSDNNIFTIMVNNGIRIAICSLTIKDSLNLPKILKDILNEIKD